MTDQISQTELHTISAYMAESNLPHLISQIISLYVAHPQLTLKETLERFLPEDEEDEDRTIQYDDLKIGYPVYHMDQEDEDEEPIGTVYWKGTFLQLHEQGLQYYIDPEDDTDWNEYDILLIKTNDTGQIILLNYDDSISACIAYFKPGESIEEYENRVLPKTENKPHTNIPDYKHPQQVIDEEKLTEDNDENHLNQIDIMAKVSQLQCDFKELQKALPQMMQSFNEIITHLGYRL